MSDDLSTPELDALEAALEAWILADGRGGIVLGAVIAVERRMENNTGIPGAIRHRLDYGFTHGATPAQTYGLAHWLRETMVHGCDEGDTEDEADEGNES